LCAGATTVAWLYGNARQILSKANLPQVGTA